MAKKSLGYVRLEWTCPFCGNRNPGPQEKCSQCQAPQPADVKFEQAVEEEIITDPSIIDQAKSGPDIHCPFCGARNQAGADTCVHCQGDLSEGETRASGQILGQHRQEKASDIACGFCGAENPASALQCSQCGASLAKPVSEHHPERASTPKAGKRSAPRRANPLIYIAIAAVVVLCLAMAAMYFRTDELTGRVTDASWALSVGIEELQPVSYEAWNDELPEDAALLSCRQELRHTEDQPVAGSVEVCGEPYTVDDGTGFGEVVQDCEYQVYADFCEYTVDEWQVVDQVVQRGSDYAPSWPNVQLASNQRQGERSEEYEVTFDSDGQIYTYHTGNYDLFAQCEIGSRWNLEVNTFGTVLSISSDQ